MIILVHLLPVNFDVFNVYLANEYVNFFYSNKKYTYKEFMSKNGIWYMLLDVFKYKNKY